MPTLEEVLAGESTSEYMYVEGYAVDNNYVDENFVEILDRVIGDTVNNVSAYGEELSQAITFKMARYVDGIDLTATGKLIKIHYELADGTGSDDAPINVKCNDTSILLTWVIPAAATVMASKIQFIVYVIGDNYIFKTLSAPYTINKSLDIGGGLPEPDVSWYTDFVRQMEAYVVQCAGAVTSAAEAKTSATEAKTSAAEAATSAASIVGDVEKAAASATAAKTSETNAKTSETNAKASEDDVAANAAAAKTSETNAKASETAAKTSETNAKTSETAAKTSETNAATSETNAKASETAAKTSETNASTSESNAKTSETNAATSESNAKASETASGLNATSAANSSIVAKASETNAKTSEVNAEESAKKAAQSASSVQGVKYSKSQWYLSTSATEETGGEWVDVMPELTSGTYLWNRTFTDYSDGSTTMSTAVLVTGINALRDAITTEVSRAQAAEQANATAIQNEATTARAAEEANATAITVEETRAKAAEETKSNKPSYIDKTLASSGWNDSIFSFDTDYPFASYDLKVFLSPNATDDQYKAWSKAGVNTGSETVNSIKAFGTIPTVDIPILLKVVEK